MKKTYALIICVIFMIFSLSGCGAGSGSNNDMYGDWVFCGVVEEGGDYSKENIIIDDELKNLYGVSEMPNNTITISKDGVKGIYENVPGTEVGEVEWANDYQFRHKITINVLDGNVLDEPIVMDVYYTMKDGYLFVEDSFQDDSVGEEYGGGNVNVHKKK